MPESRRAGPYFALGRNPLPGNSPGVFRGSCPRSWLALGKKGLDFLLQLDAAQKADPSNPLTYLYIGLAWQDLDRPQQAAAAYERVLGLSQDPTLVDLARSRLLVIYTQIIPAAAGQEGGTAVPSP